MTNITKEQIVKVAEVVADKATETYDDPALLFSEIYNAVDDLQIFTDPGDQIRVIEDVVSYAVKTYSIGGGIGEIAEANECVSNEYAYIDGQRVPKACVYQLALHMLYDVFICLSDEEVWWIQRSYAAGEPILDDEHAYDVGESLNDTLCSIVADRFYDGYILPDAAVDVKDVCVRFLAEFAVDNPAIRYIQMYASLL